MITHNVKSYRRQCQGVRRIPVEFANVHQPNFEPLLSTRRRTKLDHKFAALQVCKQLHMHARAHARTHNILIETSFLVILTRKGV